jgi:hypothetical protein
MKWHKLVSRITYLYSLIKPVGGWMSLYSLLIIICLLSIAHYEYGSTQIGIFDLIASIRGAEGSTNHFMFMFLGIPVIVTVLTHAIRNIENSRFLLHMKSRFQIYHTQVFLAFGISLFLTVFLLILSFLIGNVLVGMENTWLSPSGTIMELIQEPKKFQSIIDNLASERIVFLLFLTKFLGFLMISFCTLFLYQFTKSSPLIMIILLILSAIDHIGIFPIPIFTWNAILSINDWLEPITTVYHSVLLIVISLCFYGITGWLYERKDFIR